MSDAELVREALRIYRRYATEIIERHAFCPWAERARQEGHVAERVLTQSDTTDTAPSLAAIAELDADAETEIGLLIYPRLPLGRLDFEHFVAHIRRDDTARHQLGSVPFAMAAFHPDARADLSDPERLIPFIRRSPDPTIQLVRQSVLERVRSRSPEGTAFIDPASLDLERLLAAQEKPTAPLRQRIARANQQTVAEVGVAELEAQLDDILRDRDESYARFGLPGRRGATG
jgi:hypothetical protein